MMPRQDSLEVPKGHESLPQARPPIQNAIDGVSTNEDGEMALLIQWFEEKERVDYQTGDPLDYLKQDMFTPQLLKELALYEVNRNAQLRVRYKTLIDEVESVFENSVPELLRGIIKDPEVDLIPQPDPDI